MGAHATDSMTPTEIRPVFLFLLVCFVCTLHGVHIIFSVIFSVQQVLFGGEHFSLGWIRVLNKWITKIIFTQ